MKNRRWSVMFIVAMLVLVLMVTEFLSFATIHHSVPTTVKTDVNQDTTQQFESENSQTGLSQNGKTSSFALDSLPSSQIGLIGFATNGQENSGNSAQESIASSSGNVESAQFTEPQLSASDLARLGKEVSVLHHLQDGDEYTLPIKELIKQGEELFKANWTIQEGAGRPLDKGTGLGIISDHPLTFPRNMNRVSGPDANSCAGCHNAPFGIVGGGGDFVTNVFVLAQRFDFASFDASDDMPSSGMLDENGKPVTLQTIGNNRSTIGMYGSGYLEMLARQMTTDLQTIRNQIAPEQSLPLSSKGISFGILGRDSEGNWDVSKVEGLPTSSITTTAPSAPPTLIVNPFHQVGGSVSLRNFTNNAFNHHMGIQSTERFGENMDKDGDGVRNELTRADVTAVTIFQATMAVPGRVIPNDPVVEQAIWNGEQKFNQIGCNSCHVSALPLDQEGWVFVEPNPFNTADDLRPSEAPELRVDLNDPALPQPRLQPKEGVVWVPAYTDLKLHNISTGADDPTCEPLNMSAKMRSPQFFAGNCRFLTKKLWGAANEPPYFHHGLFTTLREATLAHSGEAIASRQAFEALDEYGQASIIEFLKSLQVLPPGTQSLTVDENGQPKQWPPNQ